MSDRTLVSPDLRIDGFDDEGLRQLLAVAAGRAGGGGRWAVGTWDGVQRAVRPQDGSLCDVADVEAFCAERDTLAVVLDETATAAFCRRFTAARDVATMLRFAGAVAPLLGTLHPGHVRGVRYRLEPAERTQQLINLAGRFLPKRRGLALRGRDGRGAPWGLYVTFDGERRVDRIIGLAAWPQDVGAHGPLAGLASLGVPVEVGADLDADGVEGLLHGRLNRAGFAALFRARSIRLDPCPLTLKLALKAARIM